MLYNLFCLYLSISRIMKVKNKNIKKRLTKISKRSLGSDHLAL